MRQIHSVECSRRKQKRRLSRSKKVKKYKGMSNQKEALNK